MVFINNCIEIICKKGSKIIVNTLHNTAPLYLQELFCEYTIIYNLRCCDGKLFLPKPNTEYLKFSFSYSGAKLWNSLPDEARNAKNMAHLKKELDRFFHLE